MNVKRAVVSALGRAGPDVMTGAGGVRCAAAAGGAANASAAAAARRPLSSIPASPRAPEPFSVIRTQASRTQSWASRHPAVRAGRRPTTAPALRVGAMTGEAECRRVRSLWLWGTSARRWAAGPGHAVRAPPSRRAGVLKAAGSVQLICRLLPTRAAPRARRFNSLRIRKPDETVRHCVETLGAHPDLEHDQDRRIRQSASGSLRPARSFGRHVVNAVIRIETSSPGSSTPSFAT